MMYQNKTIIWERRTPNMVVYWIIFFLFLFTILLIALFVKFEIKFYYPGFITKIGNEYYVKIYSKDKEVGKLNRKEVYINGKKYSLTYTKIKEAYTIDQTLEIYHEVYLKLSLPKKLKIENNKVDVLFDIKQSTLLDILIERLKQGVYETIK